MASVAAIIYTIILNFLVIYLSLDFLIRSRADSLSASIASNYFILLILAIDSKVDCKSSNVKISSRISSVSFYCTCLGVFVVY